MQASTVKLISAAIIATVAVTAVSVVGFTADSVDAKQGVMIDSPITTSTGWRWTSLRA